MSGHSKWHNIRVKKMAGAAARGKVFTKHARLIEIAAREGGGDAGGNAKLRSAIDAAREENVPNANIDRAVRKGTGQLAGEAVQEALYEAYGPAGTAYLIECLTDNRNRTLGQLRTILSKLGGRLAEGGSVAWMFDRKGVVAAICPAHQSKENLEELELELIDFGAEDLDVSGTGISVTTAPTQWPEIRDFLKNQQCEIRTAGLQYIPKQKVPLADLKTATQVMALLDALEEEEDVSEVHTNADISEEIAKQLG